MGVAIGIMAGVFSMALSLLLYVNKTGNSEDKTEVTVAAISLLVSWISGGILVALIMTRLFA